jgi:hypothetical protein
MRPCPHPPLPGPRRPSGIRRMDPLEGAGPEAANDGTRPPVRCGRCGREHPSPRWNDLELVERMSASRVRGLVTVWRRDWTIEIRRCDACGAHIARRQLPEAGT